MEKKTLKIGDLAQRAQVTTQTVRYYERLGLLRARRKSRTAFRTFGGEAIDRLKVIRGLQMLDIPLEKIKEILEIRSGSDTGDSARVKLTCALDKEVQRIDQKVTEYLEMRRLLLEVVAAAQGCEGCQIKPEVEVCEVCKRPLEPGRQALVALT